MNEIKILGIANPILRTWASENHLFSMILLEENSLEWVYNNYMNLIGYDSPQHRQNLLAFIPKHNPLDTESPLNAWKACPFLETNLISANDIKASGKNILEYVFELIENGYYIYLYLDQEYLQTRVKARYHQTFIYGYNKAEQKLYVADHYKNMKYARSEIGFKQFVEAYNAVQFNLNNSDMQKNSFEKHFLVRAKVKAKKYEFNITWFRMQLEDYLNAQYSLDCAIHYSFPDTSKIYMGISSYDLLLDYIDKILNKNREVNKDWRIFTSICDHKKIMKMRAIFFQEKGICEFEQDEIEKYEELCSSAEIMLNLFLKHKETENYEYLSRIKVIGKNMKACEKQLLKKLLAKLNY